PPKPTSGAAAVFKVFISIVHANKLLASAETKIKAGDLLLCHPEFPGLRSGRHLSCFFNDQFPPGHSTSSSIAASSAWLQAVSLNSVAISGLPVMTRAPPLSVPRGSTRSRGDNGIPDSAAACRRCL